MNDQIKDYALKHSCSHLMASAVQQLYPNVKLAIGPPTEEGFYYDFGNVEISDADLENIEATMKTIAKQNLKFEQVEKTVEEAKELLKEQPYKLEIVEGISGTLTFYKHGDFMDLCEGPHVRYTKEIKHFKLMKVAGAYWRGDEHNPMLTRIYGVVFGTKEELDSYLHLLEEAKKRDHKKLGKQLDLFTFSPLVGGGLPLWTPKGTLLRSLLDDFIWSLRKEKGYQKVTIPHITKKHLYEKSGHWKKFQEELFKITTREGHLYAFKPMNCPHHAQIYARKAHSYRELPQRYCETTMVYRDEQSGELSGLSRVLSITQDDAHVFCRKDQIAQEINHIWDIINSFYSVFGFALQTRFSRHDPNDFGQCMGDEALWQDAEKQMLDVIQKRTKDYIDAPGEQAFYGPKIDFVAKDALGREWQLATIQLDFNQPQGFDLKYWTADNSEARPVMIHAAIAGSFERFLSVLIEHLAGVFPVWLSPVQVKIVTVTERSNAFAEKIQKQLEQADIRVEMDTRSETMGKKVRDAQIEHVPYILTIGDKEVEKQTLAIRTRDGKVHFDVAINDFVQQITDEVNARQ